MGTATLTHARRLPRDRAAAAPGAATSTLAGALGGLAGSLAMNLFGRALLRVRGGREAPGAAPGADRTGRGVQPAQSEGSADEDATVRAASGLYRSVIGHEPDRITRRQLGSAAHYAFGAGAGAAYGLLAARLPALRAGSGTFYGALVWALADEGLMPALGLSRGPRRLSPAVHAYALAGHVVFGAALEAVMHSIAGRSSDLRVGQSVVS
jgi:hypothetical protein